FTVPGGPPSAGHLLACAARRWQAASARLPRLVARGYLAAVPGRFCPYHLSTTDQPTCIDRDSYQSVISIDSAAPIPPGTGQHAAPRPRTGLGAELARRRSRGPAAQLRLLHKPRDESVASGKKTGRMRPWPRRTCPCSGTMDPKPRQSLASARDRLVTWPCYP